MRAPWWTARCPEAQVRVEMVVYVYLEYGSLRRGGVPDGGVERAGYTCGARTAWARAR